MDPEARGQDAQPLSHMGLLRSPGNSSLRVVDLLEGSAINTCENFNRIGAVGLCHRLFLYMTDMSRLPTTAKNES